MTACEKKTLKYPIVYTDQIHMFINFWFRLFLYGKSIKKPERSWIGTLINNTETEIFMCQQSKNYDANKTQ